MHPVRRYGEAVALVTVTRTAVAPSTVLASLPAAGRGPVQVCHVDTAGAPAGTGATVLRLSEDVGRPAAINRAVAGLGADVGWVALAEPWVAWGAGALDQLLDAGRRQPRAAVLAPRLGDAAGRERAVAGALPTPADALRGRIPAGTITSVTTGAGPVGPGAGSVGWVASTCVLVRRVAWDSVGGFDPRYTGCASDPEPADVDLGDRLARAGWLVVGVGEAEAGVRGDGGQAIMGGVALETRDRALRRYGRDRYRASVRTLMALARRH